MKNRSTSSKVNEGTNQQAFRLMNDQDTDAVFSLDLKYRFHSANMSFLDLAECSIENVMGKKIQAFLHPGQVVSASKHFKRVSKGNTEHFKIKIITAKGNERIVSLSSFPVFENGQIVRLNVITRGMSNWINKENELKSIENKYYSAVENSLTAFILTMPSGPVIDANQAALKLFGYNLEEIRKLNRSDVLDSNDPNLAPLIALREKQGYVKGELIGIRSNGERFPCEFSSVLFKDLYGNSRISTNIIDITERKSSENEIHHKQQLLNAIVENADVGIAVANRDGQFLIYNQTMSELIGVEQTDAKEFGLLAIDNLFYPNGQIQVPSPELPIVKAFNGDLVINKKYLVKNRFKGNKYISISSFAIRDPEGKIIGGMVIDKDITKQITHEQELTKAIEDLNRINLRFKYATQAVSDAIWDWDIVTNDLFSGDGFKTLFGRTLTDLKIDEDFWKDHIHPDDQKRVIWGIYQALDNSEQTLWQDEFRYLKADQTYAIVIDKGLIIRNAEGKAIRMIGAMKDISELKANEAALKESNERFSYAAKATSEAIWEWNSRDPGIFKEYGYKDLFGYDINENIGDLSFWLSKIHPDDYTEVLNLKSATEHNPKHVHRTIEYRFLKSNNEYVFIKDKAILLRDCYGNLVRMIGSMRDITRQKLSEKKLNELNAELEKKIKQLTLSNAELEQFAYVASHDLQEPLRMVTSFMAQLEKKYGDVVDEKGRQYIRFAVDGAKRMRQLILDLLDFSKVGSMEDDKEDVNFNKLMNDILVLYRRQIEELHAQIRFENLPTLRIYKTPLMQVFKNLVGNSLKYHRKDTAPVIDISCKETKTYYQFSVKDNGIGIAPEYFEKIFIIFQRLHNKDEYSGTGMGLAITKKIVEGGGGKIWLESEEGKGSTFYFTILKK